MDNRCTVFLKVLEVKSFTKAAEVLGYSQSAVSQSIRSLEEELGVSLLERSSRELSLTADGRRYLPYIQAIDAAERALSRKKAEISGLLDARIRIGTFTSVSRNILPPLMKEFRRKYPGVTFELIQGDYDSIADGIQNDRIDFGFVNSAFISGLETIPLFQDTMMAVLPPNHPLASQSSLSLRQMTQDPFIELDEGEYSVAIEAFEKNHIHPHVCYKVTDDYSILSMVRQSLGCSILYKLVLAGYSDGVAVVPIQEPLQRTIALAWRNYDTMATAARTFADFIRKNIPRIISSLDL